jgi:hypothetical protein
MPNEKYERLFGISRAKKEDLKNNKHIVDFQSTAPLPAKNIDIEMTKVKTKKYKDSANHTNDHDEEQRSLIKSHKNEFDMGGLNFNKGKKKDADKKENLFSTQDYNKSDTDLTKDIEEDIKNEYEYLPKPQTQMEVGEEHLL